MRGQKVLGSKISSTGHNCKKTAKSLFDEMIEDYGLKENEIQYTVATGYGRRMVSFNEVVTEITANATAAKWLMRNKVNVRTLINIGGQTAR